MPIFYRALFYLPLGLLHASLVLRTAGDVGAWFVLRRWGALGGAAAILLFLISVGYAVLATRGTPLPGERPGKRRTLREKDAHEDAARILAP